MPARKTPTPGFWKALRPHEEQRLNMMRSWRFSWMEHYSLLETYMLPRRGIFINAAQPTPNTMIRGMAINQAILDPTGTYAMRTCAAGLMSNEMSPSRQWFKLKPALNDREQAPPEAVQWFEEVENRISVVMNRSNFYQEAAQMFEDLVTFGTGPMLIYEDEKDLVRCYTPCPGEYLLSSSSANRVGVFARLFVMTVSALVEMFGLENCPREVQEQWKQKGAALEVERIVAHMIEPNFPVEMPGHSTDDEIGVVPGGFPWRETYWCWGLNADYPLSWGGFLEPPFVVPRWAVTSNDAYGRSVGMDVLPDVLQLQVMTARLAEAEEKLVRPPLLASLDMKNEPSSILPGRITYVQSLSAEKGMRPAYTVNPQIREFGETIKEVQLRIRQGFFNDLFMGLEQVTKQMTAFEVAQRNQEKLQVLGPVVERLQNECLAPAIGRIFRILERKLLLPPLPPALHGVPIGLEYVGVLALAQKAAKTASLERYVQIAGQLQAIDPTIADVWDPEYCLREISEDLFLPQKVNRSPAAVDALRKHRAAQQQAATALQAGQAMANIGETASNIQVGSGINAVQLATGLGAGGSGGQ